MERILEPEYMDTAADAEDYDSMDHGAANEAVTARFLELLPAAGHVLDVGTGPAQIPVLLAQRSRAVRVVAVDAAAHMLRIAQRRVAAAGLQHRVRLERADAKRLPHPDGAFDGVFSNTILHHIPDPVPFLREAHRVLRPGGTLLVRDLFRPATEADAWALVDRHAAGANRTQRQLFFASFHAALTLDEARAAASAAGIAGARVAMSSDRHYTIELAGRSA
jgi:ubiquinone/menaquinone biosynthesis C-methylase UbiE